MDRAQLDDPKYMQRYSDKAKGDNTLERDKLPDNPAPLTPDQIAVIQHQIKSRGITFLKGLSHFIITDCAEPEIWQGFVDDYAKSLEPPDTVFRFPAHSGRIVKEYPHFEVDQRGNLSLWESNETRTLFLPKETAGRFAAWLAQMYPEKGKDLSSTGRTR